MENSNFRKILLWVPRIFAMVLTLFTLVGLLNFLTPEGYRWDNLVYALIPGFAVFILSILVWFYPRIGGLLFVLAGIGYALFANGGVDMWVIAVVSALAFLIGLLPFIPKPKVDAKKKLESKEMKKDEKKKPEEDKEEEESKMDDKRVDNKKPEVKDEKAKKGPVDIGTIEKVEKKKDPAKDKKTDGRKEPTVEMKNESAEQVAAAMSASTKKATEVKKEEMPETGAKKPMKMKDMTQIKVEREKLEENKPDKVAELPAVDTLEDKQEMLKSVLADIDSPSDTTASGVKPEDPKVEPKVEMKAEENKPSVEKKEEAKKPETKEEPEIRKEEMKPVKGVDMDTFTIESAEEEVDAEPETVIPKVGVPTKDDVEDVAEVTKELLTDNSMTTEELDKLEETKESENKKEDKPKKESIVTKEGKDIKEEAKKDGTGVVKADALPDSQKEKAASIVEDQKDMDVTPGNPSPLFDKWVKKPGDDSPNTNEPMPNESTDIPTKKASQDVSDEFQKWLDK